MRFRLISCLSFFLYFFSTLSYGIDLTGYFAPDAASFPERQQNAQAQAKTLVRSIKDLQSKRSEADLFKAAAFSS